MNQYYIYIWFIKDTFKVFYVGRGHGNRYKILKKRTKYFKDFYEKYDCDSMILINGLSEEQSIALEPLFISFYRDLEMAKANIHNGGNIGGDVFSNMPIEDKIVFVEKMKVINKERCSTTDFKEAARIRMKKRYEDTNERLKQSEKQKGIWTEEKRKKQSELIKKTYQENEELIERRKLKFQKKCVFVFKDDEKVFNSYKELREYAKEKYGFSCSRKIEQDMLKNRKCYKSQKAKYKKFNGLLMYYVV